MITKAAIRASGALFALVLAGCQGGGPLLPWTRTFGSDGFQGYLRLAGYAAKLGVATPSPGSATFTLQGHDEDYREWWEASRGSLSASEGRTTTWSAPGPSEPRPLIAYVRCRVSSRDAGTERLFRIRLDLGDQVKVEPLDDLGYLDDTSM